MKWVAALGTLAASYGTFAYYGLRLLFPGHLRPRWREVYVAALSQIPEGGGRSVTLPTGQALRIQRATDGFLALSDTCPHLGCKVHWEPQNNRFFCPCHSGVFAPDGTAMEGPPAAEGKNLARFETVVKGDALYVRYREA